MARGKRPVVARFAILVLAAAAAASCHWVLGAGDSIRFSHRKHLEEVGAECADCHKGMDAAAATDERHKAGHAQCSTCHEDWVGKECARCHTNPDRPVASARGPTPRLYFSHKDHLPRVEGRCLDCHTDLKASESVAELALPAHDACDKCHGHKDDIAGLKCYRCHKDLTDQPVARLATFQHAPGWETIHKMPARRDARTCAQCHVQSFCLDCHAVTYEPGIGFEGTLKLEDKNPANVQAPYVHRGDWRTVHPLEAAHGQDLCLKCHRVASCRECHKRNRVTVDERGAAARGGDIHPDGWAGTPHAREARRNIIGCASCHERSGKADPICVSCHSDTDSDPRNGTGLNPHPKGFSRSFSEKTSACAACHPGQLR